MPTSSKAFKTEWRNLNALRYRGIVENLLVLSRCSSPPIDVQSLAHKLGVTEIRVEDIGAASGTLIRGKSKTIILLSSSDDQLRRRFSLAHEIGHIVLGSEHMDDIQWRKDSKRDLTESKCDAFASELLMPWCFFHERTEERVSIESIIGLAEDYAVSVESAALRLGQTTTDACQIIVWQAEKDRLRPKWQAGPEEFLPRGAEISIDDYLSCTAKAFGSSKLCMGEEPFFINDKKVRHSSESRSFGQGSKRRVLSVIHRQRLTKAQV